MKKYLPAMDKSLAARHWASTMQSGGVTALDRFEAAAAAFDAARDQLLAGAPSRDVLERTNAALRDVERALTRPKGS